MSSIEERVRKIVIEQLGVKEEETVVVQGIAKRDEAGNVALMASGIYIKR